MNACYKNTGSKKYLQQEARLAAKIRAPKKRAANSTCCMHRCYKNIGSKNTGSMKYEMYECLLQKIQAVKTLCFMNGCYKSYGRKNTGGIKALACDLISRSFPTVNARCPK